MDDRMIDNVVRMHIRSRYMLGLYKEKVNTGIVLSEEEKDNYVFQCALCNSSAEIIYLLFSQLIDKIPFDKLPQAGVDMLKTCQIGYEISNKKSINIKDIYNDSFYKANNYGQRDFDFGKIDLNDAKKIFAVSDSKRFNDYDIFCDQVYNFLLSCSKSNVFKTLPPIIKSYLELPEEVRVADMNKIFACWHLHQTDNTRRIIIDKEYSSLKYPEDDFSKTLDYRELLESVGIEIGQMPKTWVSEIFGLSSLCKK